MDRIEEIIQHISSFLDETKLPFKQDGSRWTLEQKVQRPVQVTVNGTPMTTSSGLCNIVQILIEVVGGGSIETENSPDSKQEFAQVHFQITTDGIVDLDFEDCIYIESGIEDFKKTFKNIFLV